MRSDADGDFWFYTLQFDLAENKNTTEQISAEDD